MARRAKMTGCGKFIIFLIIAAPLAYLGASYYNGENGIENIKSLIGIGNGGDEDASAESSSETMTLGDEEWRERLEEKDEEIEELKSKNSTLQAEIDELKKKISDLEAPADTSSN